MENVGYLAYSRAALLERATDVSTNNIANANTTGFRASQTIFESYVVDAKSGSDVTSISYGIDKGTISDLTAGALHRTGNPLDVAVSGDGWLGYMTAAGQTALGRDGSLMMTAQGDLTTASGDRILDVGGAPINIPPGTTDLTIARDGTISAGNGDVIAQIGVFDAPDIASWKKLGGSMLVPRDGGVDFNPVLEPTLMQGHVEQSNVNSIMEMARLVDLQRAYEQSMTLASTADQLRKETLSRLRPK